jgi:hypothetical protein
MSTAHVVRIFDLCQKLQLHPEVYCVAALIFQDCMLYDELVVNANLISMYVACASLATKFVTMYYVDLKRWHTFLCHDADFGIIFCSLNSEDITTREMWIFCNVVCNNGISFLSLQSQVQHEMDIHFRDNDILKKLDDLVCMCIFMRQHEIHNRNDIVDAIVAELRNVCLSTACFEELKAGIKTTKLADMEPRECAPAFALGQHRRFTTYQVAEGLIAYNDYEIESNNPCFKELFVLPFHCL